MKADNQDITFFDKLATLQLDIVGIRKAIFQTLLVHYADPRNYGAMQSLLGNIFYSSEANGTLSISFGTHTQGDKFNNKNVNKTPAIVLLTSDVDFGKEHMGHFHEINADDSVSRNLSATTNVILQHVTGAADMSLLLATQTAALFAGIGNELGAALTLRAAIAPAKLSAPTLVSVPGNEVAHYQCDVVLPLQYNFAWVSMVDCKRIKTISFKNAVAI